MFNFEKLDVWQKAIGFADLVYNHTRHSPVDERFGLTNQMRSAAVSISSNIAEGRSRISQTDFGRFIEIATGSVFEVVSQAFVGRRQGFLNEEASARCTWQPRKLGACSADCENRWRPNNLMGVPGNLSTISDQL
jgi:four helix bundle protein